MDFSFLTKMLKECQSKFEVEVMSVELAFSLKLWRGGSYSFSCRLALSTCLWAVEEPGRTGTTVTQSIWKLRHIPKQIAAYMAANTLGLRGSVESSFLVIVILLFRGNYIVKRTHHEHC